jgi:hypothetical protein
MEGGEISGNTASSSSYSYGGGVYVYPGSTFTMAGGEISGNTATSASASYGGGVYVVGTFTMAGGEIFGNTATSASASSYGGGGVAIAYISSSSYGRFAKTGGAIYGYDAADLVNSNKLTNSSGVIQSNRGHAVYYSSTYRKETMVGPDHDMTVNYPDEGDFSGWD